MARPLLNETGVPGLSSRDFHPAIRTATHEYVEHASGERELYDLRSDPDELVNVAADPAQAATPALPSPHRLGARGSRPERARRTYRLRAR
jgi:arylsulfatase A-like enzyme